MSIALRLGLFYAVLLAGSGASGPYAAVWFKSQGLSGAAIGLILASPSLGRAFTGPALALWADGFGLRRSPLVVMALGVAAGYVGLALLKGFWPWLLLWFVTQSLLAGLSPLADVITLRRARLEGFNYGWPRGMGSAAYVVANIVVGALLQLAAPDGLIAWIAAAALATAGAALWLLPPDRVHESAEKPPRRDRLKGLGELLGNPVFVLAIVSTGLIQASHGFYYGFSALTWKHQGLGESWTGLLWGAGVAVEVGFLWFAEPWRRRVGPERLILLGGLAAVARWTCLAMSPPLWLLFVVQALHALTFTATFVGSLQLVERLAPGRNASLAQTLNSVLTGGFLIGFSTMASGPLFDALGARGYFAMSLIALAGLAGAACLSPLQRSRAAARDSEAA
jgi:PPP family 3-phenylpropionic acid transporter